VATSNSWDYSLTAANVIDMAVENLGVLASGGTIVAADQTLALRRLNVIVKQYQGTADGAPGVKVHTRQRLTLFLAEGQQRYLIGPATTDARCTAQYGRTTLSAAEASGQTTISITSNTDTTTYPGTTVTMTNGDFIGVVQDNGVIHWTTISGTPGATATIAVATTGDAAAGNYVYWFTARAQRFPVLEFAYLREFDTTTFGKASDIPLPVYTDVQQYEALTDKLGDGDPTAILVEPLRITTAVTLNSQPDDVSKVVNLTALYPAEDLDATTNDIAYPQEALRFLSWELAYEIHPAFGATWTPGMEKLRQESRAMYLELNPQNTAYYFQPDKE
jgi:hypothetical protein